MILAVRSANGAAAAGVALDVTIKGEPPLEHFPKRLNRGIPLRERIGFKVRAGMEASMDGETVFGGS
ncbi:MAG: hypothetical protein ABSG18_22415, partial [Steroidobacteraceae bacterium]